MKRLEGSLKKISWCKSRRLRSICLATNKRPSNNNTQFQSKRRKLINNICTRVELRGIIRRGQMLVSRNFIKWLWPLVESINKNQQKTAFIKKRINFVEHAVMRKRSMIIIKSTTTYSKSAKTWPTKKTRCAKTPNPTTSRKTSTSAASNSVDFSMTFLISLMPANWRLSPPRSSGLPKKRSRS